VSVTNNEGKGVSIMDVVLNSGRGTGSKPGVDAIIDALRGALRSSNSPIDHSDLGGSLLGFYRATFITGASVSIGAGGILAYLRWSDLSRLLVLMRVSASVAISGAITAVTVADLGVYISRGSSAAGSGGNALTLTTNNAKMRSNMGTTLVTDARVGTTGALTRPTGGTADSNPIAASAFPLLFPVSATGTATLGAVGMATPVQDLYKWDVNASHPVVLSPSAGETVEVQEITAGPTTGSLKWYITMEWCELAYF
jgi:hypothetical protein